jgi:hypothetical protein
VAEVDDFRAVRLQDAADDVIAASCPSNSDAALTKRSGPRASAVALSIRSAGLLIEGLPRDGRTV